MRLDTCSIRRAAVVFALAILSTTNVSCAESAVSGQASGAFAQNQRLGRGVNVLGYDPIWKEGGKARFQEKYFGLIKEAGFSHIRVNLQPFRDAGLTATLPIAQHWFDTLDWVLKNAGANHLVVILDLHEYKAMGDDPIGNKKRFLAAWRQIAERCKDASDDVLFEILNEPNGKLTPELWNPLLREALAIIRQSNPGRTVVAGPTSWNGIKDLDKLDLPDDERNLIVTIHSYNPFRFTHQGASFAALQNKTGVSWTGNAKERMFILRDFETAQAWAKKHNRPLYLGEFGAYDRAEMASRVRWTSFVARSADKLGWSWAWWQFDGDFVLYNVKQDAWVEPILHALIPSKNTVTLVPTAADAVASTKSGQIIVLKLDDVRASSGARGTPVTNRWQRTADFIEKKHLKASFGIIGASLEKDNPEYFDWIKNLQRRGNIEFWNHGYRDRTSEDKTGEFEGTLESQIDALRKTQSLARDKLGFDLKAFGAHWSGTTRDTGKALDRFPEITIWFYGDKTSHKFEFPRVMTLENPIFHPDPEKFRQYYEKNAADKPCLALQGHADQWDDQRWQGFVKIVEYLQSKGCVFMTASECMKKMQAAQP